MEFGGTRLALAGFPYCREGVRSKFRELVAATRWTEERADVHLLCVHHCFEGATVGSHNYTFRNGKDVVRARDVPAEFAAVITGHIHRAQVLQRDLRGMSLDTPILYPGAVERTSFAERNEEKGYFLLQLKNAGLADDVALEWEFRRLPTRPMLLRELSAGGLTRDELDGTLLDLLRKLPRDAVVQIRIHGSLSADARTSLTARHIRAMAPATMNVEVIAVDERNTPSSTW
jgi:DNA repair exonuclease SbcCD nuclease subunit